MGCRLSASFGAIFKTALKDGMILLHGTSRRFSNPSVCYLVVHLPSGRPPYGKFCCCVECFQQSMSNVQRYSGGGTFRNRPKEDRQVIALPVFTATASWLCELCKRTGKCRYTATTVKLTGVALPAEVRRRCS